MAKKKIHEGKCAICGVFGRLSFEHIPPRSAFNHKPILVQDHEKLFEQSSPVFGKHSKSNKGFGRHTLCESCNNKTGDWYARDFTEFSKQGMEFLKSSEHPTQIISGQYKIKPLNVIKQVCTMFMAISPGWLQLNDELVSFILEKESNSLPKNYQIFMYSTFSKYKRMMGMQVVYSKGKVSNWAEFNFQPFGFLLCDKSDPPNEFLVDITGFSNFQLDQEVEVKIGMPLLHIKQKDIWVGTYDNVE
jgi:hypothetical protein